MADKIERARFYEGQILGADDLSTAQAYGRDQMARHHRLVHDWGIVTGLALEGLPSPDDPGRFDAIRVGSGMAIDGTGREIVVPEAQELTVSDFTRFVHQGGGDGWFPLFLVGHDDTPTTSTPFSGGCDGSQPDRAVEDFALVVGRPGEDEALDEQATVDVAARPGSGQWRILLGYAQWDFGAARFSAIWPDAEAAEGPQPGSLVPLRYVGVRAARVISPSDTLTLAVRGAEENGAVTLRVRRANDANNELQVGALNAEGQFVRALWINAKGDLVTEGKIDARGGIESTVDATTAADLVGKDGRLALRSGQANEPEHAAVFIQRRSDEADAVTPRRVTISAHRPPEDGEPKSLDVLQVSVDEQGDDVTGARIELLTGEALTVGLAPAVGDARIEFGDEPEIRFPVGADPTRRVAITKEGLVAPFVSGPTAGGLVLSSGEMWLKLISAGGLQLGRTEIDLAADPPPEPQKLLSIDASGNLAHAGRIPGTAFVSSDLYLDGDGILEPRLPGYVDPAAPFVERIVHLTPEPIDLDDPDPPAPAHPDPAGAWAFAVNLRCVHDEDPNDGSLSLVCKRRWFDLAGNTEDDSGRARCTVIWAVHEPEP